MACRDRRCATGGPTGVTEICPANASFQVKFDPDRIAPDRLLDELLREIEAEVGDAHDFDARRRGSSRSRSSTATRGRTRR